MTEYFSRIEFENFGPIKKSTLNLTRLHALVGPNDSGKSTTLRGLEIVSTSPGYRPISDKTMPRQESKLTAHIGATKFVWKCSKMIGWGVQIDSDNREHRGNEVQVPAAARILRLDPDELRANEPLLRDDEPLDFKNSRGRGLAAVLDAIQARNPRDFVEIEKSLIVRFPTIDGLRFFTSKNGRGIGVRLRNGEEVKAEQLSEGMLYYLAFCVLKFLHPYLLVMVEEPENGLHPTRIKEIVGVLREMSETTQVVMATHSPLVLNELRPEEVTVVSRDLIRGTVFTPISETPDFEARSKVFALGELWLSFADGKQDKLELVSVGA